MKEINIRFVKMPKRKLFHIQKMNMFGSWKYIGYWEGSNAGDVWGRYINESKKKLLKEVLERHFKRPNNQLIIVQHPTIKIY